MIRVVKIIMHIVNLMKNVFKTVLSRKMWIAFSFLLIIGKNINEYIIAEFSENGYLI